MHHHPFTLLEILLEMTKLLEMGKWEMCSITDDMEGYHSHPENQGALV